MRTLMYLTSWIVFAFLPEIGWTSVSFNSYIIPTAIEQCLGNQGCSVSDESVFELGDISAFKYQESDANGYLIRYSVEATSYAQQIMNQSQTTTPLSGSVWLRVWDHYPIQHLALSVNLYVDTLSGNLLSRDPASPTDTLHFYFDAESLDETHGESHVTSSGLVTETMLPEERIIVCLSDGCGAGQILNLIGVQFDLNANGEQLDFAFNPLDSRALLYEEYFFDHLNPELPGNYDSYRRIFVQPIPLPGSYLFLLTGLGNLFLFFRTKLRRARS